MPRACSYTASKKPGPSTRCTSIAASITADATPSICAPGSFNSLLASLASWRFTSPHRPKDPPYVARRLGWQHRRLIFFDESGVNISMTRAYGRAPTNERVYGSVPKNWGGNITLSAGLTRDGLIAPLRLVGAMSSDVFEAYIEQFVVPELLPGDVVVMDNLSAHKRASIGAMIAEVGADLVYLPPYSPDLNPIEMSGRR